MASGNHGTFLRGIERIFDQGSLTGVGEGQLLREYATGGDAAAFEALVTRHGAMVVSVCRRMLYDPRDIEDAFQATFLVLLRRAGSLGNTDPLSPWLHGVAYRVAARIRANAARRRAEERAAARPEAVEFASEAERYELRGILDEEINRLPEKYRRPVVLCYLEGRTQEEAARRLRCTAGSVRGRLDRAREKLRDRLVRRGLAPAAGLVASIFGAESASAAVPPRLIGATVSTLGRAATARAVAATGISTAVCELADGLIRTMIIAKLKLAASVVAAGTAVLALGILSVATLPRSVARDGQDARAGVAPRRLDPAESPKFSQTHRAISSIDLQVVDQRTGKPLAGVAVTVKVERKDAGRATTDNEGHAAIAVPTPIPNYLAVSVRKDGFATMTSVIRDPRTRSGDIPASFAVTMHPVESVAGVVHDEQGRPIEGVFVKPMIWIRSGGGGTDRDDFEDQAPVKTDAQGRWEFEGMPAGIDSSRVAFRFSHADYQPIQLPSDEALALIRRGTATVLHRGLDIAGRVVDAADRPIHGARVYRGGDQSELGVRHADTGPDGRFRFIHVPAGETILTVQAIGHAPDLRKIILGAGLAPVEFRLDPGRKIHGRVFDKKGIPLAGTMVVADGWRGYRSLDWRTTTDDDGRFQWSEAPTDAFWIDVLCKGYLAVRRREFPPTGDELSITLTKELKVRGTVVDAETHHAIPSFTLVPGSERGGDALIYWRRDQARPLSRGQYEIQFDESSREGYRLRIEADGYAPAVSRLIRDDEDAPVINFVLHKGAGVTGVVHLPDGSPAAGADVVLVTPSQPAFIIDGRPPDRDGNRVVKTRPDGHFAFPAQEPPYTIVALHDLGFAEQRIGATPSPACDMTVKPWGRIEGMLRIGTRPWAGQSLNLSYSRGGDTFSAAPWWSGSAKSEASGRFVLERVMPGEISISRAIQTWTTPSSTSWTNSHTAVVDVRPAQAARVVIGGTGRPVIGKVTAPTGIAGHVEWLCSQNWLTRTQPEVKPPAGLDVDAKQKWYEAWSRSPEGKAYRRAQRWYGLRLEHDGSFRLEDVEAGIYNLLINVNEPPRGPHSVGFGDNLLGSANREVVVPDMPGGRSDEVLDLGSIPLVPAKKMAHINVGDPAPTFQIEALDGKSLNLSGYRGKYVLLDFWATWCGPCLAETPHLKAVFEAFGKDDRFVMVGLSLDKTKDDPRQYAVKHGLDWVQGFLGEWADGKLPDAYGIRGIPSIWLIGPNGNVVAKDLRGGQIKDAVAKALAQP
jgi:RNA polymerase sigma factor (sigma-70 family)